MDITDDSVVSTDDDSLRFEFDEVNSVGTVHSDRSERSSEITRDDVYSESSDRSSESSSSDSDDESEELSESSSESEDDTDDLAWMNEKLHPYTDVTTGETIDMLLDHFFRHCITEACLDDYLRLAYSILPQPNNLSKNKYQFLKLVNSLTPSNGNVIKKHLICVDCSHYLGLLIESDDRAGIYYSSVKKPAMDAFLKPIIDTMIDLGEHGVEWFNKSQNSIERSIVLAPIASLDLPARAAAQNVMQYNGEHGCTFCEHPGITCKVGRGHNRSYPELSEKPPPRTDERMLEQANIAIENEWEQVNGVKAVPNAANLPGLSPSDSFVGDPMHGSDLGIGKKMTILFFDEKYSAEPWYVSKDLQKQIDLAIAKIAPPDFITRAPQGLEHRPHWKTSEYRDHTLHYLPILLKDKLPKKYYDHFMLFSNAKWILSQASISQDEIDLAEKLNDEFVGKFHLLYGEVHCTINIHQASHMAELVRKWGPQWVWSMSDFEDGMGYYKRISHGPN
ncbi:hypothetical protein QAD02_008154 [Eretmocerus hayati]|uniref:Uncharacterized protein n=1 Tax=Eretmocerus hayati TaxID=131215 RepID=A0ACC2N836_9HYME|nr:hypothetical protein QAD02_008154 [Eretmocerus hayati]